jgi:CYTH domain-containing protein
LNFYQEQNSLKRPGGLVEVTNDERYYNAYWAKNLIWIEV